MSSSKTAAEAVEWDEQMKFEYDLEIDAESYVEWIKSFFHQYVWFMKDPYARMGIDNAIDVGNCRFYLKELPYEVPETRGGYFFLPAMPTGRMKRATLQTVYGGKRGKVRFTDRVPIPVLTLPDSTEPWMSLAPMEVFSQRAGVRRMKGRVCIGGMGMGWFASRVLERKQVTHVTVVEKNKDILDEFGENLQDDYGEDRLKLVHGDIWEHLGIEKIPNEGRSWYGARYKFNGLGKGVDMRYDAIGIDIWEAYEDKVDDRKFESLEDVHPCVWGWGGVGVER